jgi:hypothetical protein
MDSLHYVYIYFDKTKKDKYTYGSYCFEYEPMYVGRGKGSRIDAHTRPSIIKNDIYFHRHLKKLIENKIEFCYEKYRDSLTQQEAIILEKELIKGIGKKIDKQGPLYNITDGGEGITGMIGPMKGRKHSEESKRKISKNSKHGKPCLGRKHTIEEREAVSNKLKGISKSPFSEEHIRNLRDSHLGKPQSLETKEKRAKKQMKKVLCIETGEIFTSIKEAGITPSLRAGISCCCRGLRRTAGGYQWRYAFAERQ